MASRSISVTMESSYRSSLSKGLRQDKQKIDAFQDYLNKRGFTIPVRINLKGFQEQAGAMRKIVLGAFADLPASILGADGRPASTASSGKAGNNRAGLLSRTTTTTYDKAGAAQQRISELEQLGKGLSSIQTFKPGAARPLSTVTKDISNVNQLRDSLRGMNEELRKTYGAARGRGDRIAQIEALETHRVNLNAALQNASGKGLENSPHYVSGENQVRAVGERIAALQGGVQSRSDKVSAANDRRLFDNKLRREEERVDLAQKSNTQDLIRANTITDITRREAELNRLYDERRKIFSDSQRRFQSVDAARQAAGDSPGADKAMRRGLNMGGHAAQVDVERDRSVVAERSRQAAFQKAEDAKAHADRASGFSTELQDIKTQSALRLAAINAAEQSLASGTHSQARKKQIVQDAHTDRQLEYQDHIANMSDVEARAAAAGNAPSATAARTAAQRAQVASALQDARQSRASSEADSNSSRLHANKLRREEERVDMAQKANSQDLIRANTIGDLTHREAELNRLYDERRKIFSDSQRRFQSADASRRAAGDSSGADQAMHRGLNMAGSAAQVDVERERAMAAVGSRQAAARKAQDAQDHADRATSFAAELQDIKIQSALRIAAINAAERSAQAATQDPARRRQIAQDAHISRQREYQARESQFSGVEGRASAAGNAPSAVAAHTAAQRAQVTAARDMASNAAAATSGGHALDFHSSALLRNAATYARWMIPVKAVMGITEAFMAGVNGAIKVDHQFAILQAVFQGTAEEAQKLKLGTLELAASQGRSADEAMDAAIRWSRLGLSRVQVLEATRVSLIAANVAEITSSEAAEKLSAIYATFRLNVGDLAGVLNSLNSISNNYNVTVDDMFQGISRVGGIAKQSGLELMDLEGIIGSVVGATGLPGAEMGNALKFVISRLAAPDTQKNLKEAFKLDLTEPNGDLKSMSQIIRELADLFPTLNNAQKQTFLSLTAGSRQASRFALVLDQYRQGQALAAQAMNDNGVSANENQLILESLEARIQSLKTTWVELFTTMGDAGAMNRAGEFFRYMREVTMEYTGSIEAAKKATGELVVNNPQLATLIESLGGKGGKFLGTREKFSKEEGENSVAKMEQFVKEAKEGKHEAFWDVNDKGKRSLVMPNNNYWGMGNTTFANLAEAEAKLKQLKELTANGGDAGSKDKLSAITAPITELRNTVKQQDTFRSNLESFAKEVRGGKMDPMKRDRDFESSVRGLQNLPDGDRLYNQAMHAYQAPSKGGGHKNDNAIGSLAENNADIFRRAHSKSLKGYEAAKPAVVAGLEKTLSDNASKRQELVEKLAKSPASEKLGITGEIKELDQVSATAIRELETLKGAIDELKESFFSIPEGASIAKYLDDLIAQAKSFGDAFKDLSPDASNDPVERIFLRRKTAAGLAVDLLKKLQEETAKTADETKAAAADNIEEIKSRNYGPNLSSDDEKKVREQQKIIDQQDALNDMIATRIRAEEKSRDIELDKLSISEKVAALVRIQTDSSKQADVSSLAWRFGETDSDKNANQARTAIARAQATMGLAFDSRWNDGSSSPAARANDAGSILQDEATARKDLENLQRRGYEIDAAIKQVNIDTLKAMREQTEEANKRLMLASREDQLRAAALSNTLRARNVGTNEFFALSQESRKALVDFFPSDAPGRLNPARDKKYKELSDLGGEQGRLLSAIDELTGGLDDLSKSITKNSGSGEALDVLPRDSDGAIQKRVTRDSNPVVTLTIGQVTIDLADQVEKIISGYVDRNLAAMEERLSRPQRPAPNSQGATE